MKKIIFTICSFLGLLSLTQAQGDVTFFSEDGQRFYLVLNGKQYNQDPQTNVKVQDFANEYAKSIVVFENPSLGQVSMDVQIAVGMETTYMVGLNNKGKYKIKYRGETVLTARPTIQPAPVPQPNNQPVYNPNQAPNNNEPIVTQPNNSPVKNPRGLDMNISMPDGEGGQVGFGINLSGIDNDKDPFGANMNINLNDGSGRTTTTTTTTTTTISNGGGRPTMQQQPVYSQPVPVQAPPAGRCVPTSASDFNTALNSIKSKSFEDSKMTIAKQITSSKCLSSAQIKEVAETFSFESNKLAYAKYAYQYCFDQQNYYIVNDVFSFESSINELTRAIGQ